MDKITLTNYLINIRKIKNINCF